MSDRIPEADERGEKMKTGAGIGENEEEPERMFSGEKRGKPEKSRAAERQSADGQKNTEREENHTSAGNEAGKNIDIIGNKTYT